MSAQSLQPCLALCNPMDCCPQGPLSMGILQARILELTCPSSGDLPNPGIEPVSLMSPALRNSGKKKLIVDERGKSLSLLPHILLHKTSYLSALYLYLFFGLAKKLIWVFP